MPSLNRLQKYAELTVKAGVNLQKGQPLMISANVDTKDFVRVIVEEAYKAGASTVSVRWNDEYVMKSAFEYESKESLTEVPDYLVKQYEYYIEKGYALISVHAETPGLLADVDSEKQTAFWVARSKALKPWREHTMGNRTQWCVISIPTPGWALKVFPGLKEDQAIEKMWDAILDAVRVQEDNHPVEEWKKHSARLHGYNEKLNAYNFKSLHFKNSVGTDLVVELVKDHQWAGGNETSTKGIDFNANMPTEENFCMPYKFGVNGKVVASKPLDFNGTLIKDFWFEFKEGKVVNYDAKEGLESLKSLVEFDENSCYLGEVALVNYESPISQSGILYMNTLFDENASCHLALGRAYPMNVKGGTEMTQEQLDALGSNNSMAHEDFMFGTKDLSVVGLTHDGQEVVVFKDGNYAF